MCNKTLQSGKRCQNKAKYGEYCKVHMHNDGAFPLLELQDDVLSHIIQFVTNPNDLRNIALVSPRIKVIVACHLEKIITCGLSNFEKLQLGMFLGMQGPDITEPDINIFLETKRWKYLLFLAIGGLYINFKRSASNFKLDNTIVSVDWKRPIIGDPLLLCIRTKEITRTSSYYTKFETTDFDEIELFFWKRFIF